MCSALLSFCSASHKNVWSILSSVQLDTANFKWKQPCWSETSNIWWSFINFNLSSSLRSSTFEQVELKTTSWSFQCCRPHLMEWVLEILNECVCVALHNINHSFTSQVSYTSMNISFIWRNANGNTLTLLCKMWSAVTGSVWCAVWGHHVSCWRSHLQIEAFFSLLLEKLVSRGRGFSHNLTCPLQGHGCFLWNLSHVELQVCVTVSGHKMVVRYWEHEEVLMVVESNTSSPGHTESLVRYDPLGMIVLKAELKSTSCIIPFSRHFYLLH